MGCSMGGRLRLGWILLAVIATGDLSATFGQDFRIDTEVFVDGRKEPIAESLTLFVEGTYSILAPRRAKSP